MKELAIGEVTKLTGLTPPTLRYYEKAGLLPKPRRVSKQRRYDPSILARLKIILIDRRAGYTIKETREFLSGFGAATIPSVRWRALAARKRIELDAVIEQATEMKAVLESSFNCRCPTIEACEQALMRRKC